MTGQRRLQPLNGQSGAAETNRNWIRRKTSVLEGKFSGRCSLRSAEIAGLVKTAYLFASGPLRAVAAFC